MRGGPAARPRARRPPGDLHGGRSRMGRAGDVSSDARQRGTDGAGRRVFGVGARRPAAQRRLRSNPRRTCPCTARSAGSGAARIGRGTAGSASRRGRYPASRDGHRPSGRRTWSCIPGSGVGKPWSLPDVRVPPRRSERHRLFLLLRAQMTMHPACHIAGDGGVTHFRSPGQMVARHGPAVLLHLRNPGKGAPILPPGVGGTGWNARAPGLTKAEPLTGASKNLGRQT